MGFFHTIFLFDGFRSVRPSLFGNTLRGGAPAGAGMRIATPVTSVTGVGMTPLRGVRGGRRCPARFHPHSTSCICSKYFRCSALVVRT